MTQTRLQPKIEKVGELYVVRLPQVPVNYDRTWEQLVTSAGPDTSRDSRIWDAGSQYPAPKSGVVLTNITLFNHGRSWESEEAVGYAKGKKFPIAGPWETYAIGETYPRLNRDLGKAYLAAVSLQKCKLGVHRRVPFLWFDLDERGAGARWFGSEWFDYCWFVLLGEF